MIVASIRATGGTKPNPGTRGGHTNLTDARRQARVIPYPRVMGNNDLRAVQEPLDFPGTVYGVPRGTSLRKITLRQCAAFGPKPDADERSS